MTCPLRLGCKRPTSHLHGVSGSSHLLPRRPAATLRAATRGNPRAEEWRPPPPDCLVGTESSALRTDDLEALRDNVACPGSLCCHHGALWPQTAGGCPSPYHLSLESQCLSRTSPARSPARPRGLGSSILVHSGPQFKRKPHSGSC